MAGRSLAMTSGGGWESLLCCIWKKAVNPRESSLRGVGTITLLEIHYVDDAIHRGCNYLFDALIG
jgi:hypothetical protein